MLEIPNETIQDEEISVATTSTAQLVTRKRGCAKDYLAVQNFPSFEDAINFVKEEKIWSVTKRTQTTHYYRCNLQPARKKPPCSASVCITKHEDNNKATLFRTIGT